MATKKKKQVVEEVSPIMLEKLKDLRKAVGLRKFMSSDDRSYTQWKNEAENLVIRIFGESSNQYDQFHDIVYWYEDKEPSKPTQSDNAAYYRMLDNGYSKEQIERMSDEEWGKLLKEKGVLKQLEKEQKEALNTYVEKLDHHTSQFKEKMRDAFTAWINEIELFVPVSDTPTRGGSSGGTRIKNIQNQKVAVSVFVNIDQTFQTIIEKIKADEPDETRVKEAEENLSVLKEEVKKENPQWSTIKKVLEWALNFGRDVFIQILPILLEKYGK